MINSDCRLGQVCVSHHFVAELILDHLISSVFELLYQSGSQGLVVLGNLRSITKSDIPLVLFRNYHLCASRIVPLPLVKLPLLLRVRENTYHIPSKFHT